jgi:putative oxidoreductase
MSVHALFIMGSWLIALLFVMSAIGKASNWAGTIQLMKAHNIPLPELGLAGSLIVEMAGAACLVFGVHLWPAVIVLSAYVLLATLFIHVTDAARNQGRRQAIPAILSNVAIVGGLLLVLAVRGAQTS